MKVVGKLLSVGKTGYYTLAALFQAALLIAAALVAIAALAAAAYAGHQARPILRDIAIAMLADKLQGPDIPLPDDFDLDVNELVLTWDTRTNSEWITQRSYEIVPFLALEKLVFPATYPTVQLHVPLVNQSSFVIAGQANSYGNESFTRLNTRFMDNQQDIIATLTHELIHIQGGYFLDAPKDYDGERSPFIESRTSTATLEVLAAMCNYGDEVSCSAFWRDMETMARRSVQAKAYRNGLGWLYEDWADRFLRTPRERGRAEKMDRFWAANREEQLTIVTKYGELPWNEQVIEGICGTSLATGNFAFIGYFDDKETRPMFLQLAMPFDDTRVMLGRLGTFLVCASR